MEGFDRRHADRLRIIGAQISYKRKNGQKFLVPLKDLTKSSACFSIENALEIGELVDIEIIIPSKDEIHVKGMITRLSDPLEENNSYAVVQFFAFGTDERYNSLKSYDQLTKVMTEFLQTVV